MLGPQPPRRGRRWPQTIAAVPTGTQRQSGAPETATTLELGSASVGGPRPLAAVRTRPRFLADRRPEARPRSPVTGLPQCTLCFSKASKGQSPSKTDATVSKSVTEMTFHHCCQRQLVKSQPLITSTLKERGLQGPELQSGARESARHAPPPRSPPRALRRKNQSP